MKIQMKMSRFLVTIGTTASILFPAVSSAQLLVDGGFDTAAPLTTFGAILTPFVPGQWAVENATKVGADGSPPVVPLSSPQMLRMLSDGLVATQAGQAVAISTPAGFIYTLGANFTAPDAVSGVVAGMSLSFYNTNFSTLLSTTYAGSLALDTGVAFQPFSFNAIQPLTANWVVAQVFFVNSTLGTNAGYVDDVVLTAVPEPSAWALMVAGVAAVTLGTRRRRLMDNVAGSASV